MNEFVVTAQIIGSSKGIGKITKTIIAEDKEEALNKFYKEYDDPKPGNYGRDDIKLQSIRAVTEKNRDSFYK